MWREPERMSSVKRLPNGSAATVSMRPRGSTMTSGSRRISTSSIRVLLVASGWGDRQLFAQAQPVRAADPRIGDLVHELPDEVDSEAADLALAQGGRKIGRREAQWIERLSAVFDLDDDAAVDDVGPYHDLAGLFRPVSVGDDVAEHLVEDHANVMDRLAGAPLRSDEAFDHRADLGHLVAAIGKSDFDPRHQWASRTLMEPELRAAKIAETWRIRRAATWDATLDTTWDERTRSSPADYERLPPPARVVPVAELISPENC